MTTKEIDCSATGDYAACSAAGDNAVCSATGDHSICSTTGDNSACSALGYKSICSTTGERSTCLAKGENSACLATGYKSACSADNHSAVAVAWGIRGKAKGVLGSHIILADWRLDENWVWCCHGACMLCIDGEDYKADTWYKMENGAIIECAD